MQLNNLIPKTKNKKTMTVGRGGKRGKTAGRGGKGQTARAGHKKRPELRDFIKRIPKLRGRGVNGLRTIETKPIVINLRDIETAFKAGDVVNPASLIEKKVITTADGKIPSVKILSVGEITKKITLEGCNVSAQAKAKIEKAGGSVKE
jgi:large subunit ribosomal protein L15